eukprot:gene12996-3764_t
MIRIGAQLLMFTILLLNVQQIHSEEVDDHDDDSVMDGEWKQGVSMEEKRRNSANEESDLNDDEQDAPDSEEEEKLGRYPRSAHAFAGRRRRLYAGGRSGRRRRRRSWWR